MNAPAARPDLVGRSVSVDVPATTANLGAGFDALAMALDLANVIRVEVVAAEGDPDVHVEVQGEGAGQLPSGPRNRFMPGPPGRPGGGRDQRRRPGLARAHGQ